MKKTLKPEEYSKEYYDLKYCNKRENFKENKVKDYLTALKYLKPGRGEKY